MVNFHIQPVVVKCRIWKTFYLSRYLLRNATFWKYQCQTYPDSTQPPKKIYECHRNDKVETLIRTIKISGPFERVFDRVQVVLDRHSERQRLWYIERTPLLLLV